MVKIQAEKNKKRGRNNPCHCGSGKKYKNCCMKKEMEESRKLREESGLTDEPVKIVNDEDDEDLAVRPAPIEVNAIPDYGRFPEGFITFDQPDTLSMSPPVLFYGELCCGMEEQEKIEKRIGKILNGRRNYGKNVYSDDPESFFRNIDESYASTNDASLIKKAMEFGEEAGPFIFERLKETETDALAELFIKMLHFSPHDFREGILEVMNTPPKNPYVLSALCIELSFYNNLQDVQIFWNCYNFLEEYYSGFPLSKGPVIALNRAFSSQ